MLGIFKFPNKIKSCDIWNTPGVAVVCGLTHLQAAGGLDPGGVPLVPVPVLLNFK